jgi:hypothetical protein
MRPDQGQSAGRFASFREFYPFYLREHSHPVSRALHAVGTAAAVLLLVLALWWRRPLLLLAVPLCGYGFAWVGHFFFEKNRPATFRHPFYSLLGDLRLVGDLLTGRRRS